MQETRQCPKCGTDFNNLASEQILCLGSYALRGVMLSNKEKTILQKPLFTKASEIPKMSLGIENLDSILPCLSSDQMIIIAGGESQKIIERLCIRSQLPKRHGGFDSKVIIVDCGNNSDLYLCVDYARRHGLAPEKSLSSIITARAFTVYQICNLVGQLPKIILEHQAKLVILCGLLDLFSDPYLDKESRQILSHIMALLSRIHGCLVIISVTDNREIDPKIFKNISRIIRVAKEIDQIKISTDNTEKLIPLGDL